VEVEAYLGIDDPASHAHRGPTNRSKIMFQEGGFSYVYRIYGMHHCFNIVSGVLGEGQAILIRAVEPLEGIPLMAKRRGISLADKKGPRKLCSGPAKLCQSFGIDMTFNGQKLSSEGNLFIDFSKALPKSRIKTSPRIGISKAQDFPWRFTVADSVFISR
jgi:DNA-3-methyladenine glycosylase